MSLSESILCRLCAIECDKYVDIYNENDGLSNMELDTKIASCLQIWVTREDILPKTLCPTCCLKLDASFEFLQKSTAAQTLLEGVFSVVQNSNCEIEGLIDAAEDVFHDNLQYGESLQDHHEIAESEIEAEVQIPDIGDPIFDEACDHLAVAEVEVPAIRSEGSPPPSQTEDASCEEGLAESVRVAKKKRNRKKCPNLCDLPDNPRLSKILQDYLWQCTICENVALQNLQELRSHYSTEHNQPPIFKCISCEKQYDRYRSFSRHIKQHRNPQRFTCDTCGKSFSQRTTLQSHAMVHTSERPHVCDTCGKSFKNFSSLQVHGKSHLPDKEKEKYQCEVCNKEVSTRHTLETHRKIHTGERDFVCDICGKSFIAKGSLDYHLISHTGDKSHVCSSCGKAFKTARHLAKHMSLHTGIKPHQCDVCGKQFRERGALREHSRIHTGAMPYTCEVCGKSFRFKGILTVHRRQHTGERPYACLDCRRFFTNWANYNKHMKRIHHCDTSRQRCNPNNPSVDTADSEQIKHDVVDDKTMNQYSIAQVGTSEMFAPSIDPMINGDQSCLGI